MHVCEKIKHEFVVHSRSFIYLFSTRHTNVMSSAIVYC